MILSLDTGKQKKPAVVTGRIIAFKEAPVDEIAGGKNMPPLIAFQVAFQTLRNRDFYGNTRKGYELNLAKCFFRFSETVGNEYYALKNAKNNDRVILFGKIYDIGRKEIDGAQKYFCRMNVETLLFPEDIAAVRGAALRAAAEAAKETAPPGEDEYLF